MPKKKKPLYQKYIDDVMSGNVLACKWVKLAVERHLRDLETGHERGLYFDEDAVDYVLGFFGFCRHSKGEWAGQTFEVEPWQAFHLAMVFGWKRADGMRRFRTSYLEVARKNGKSTESSAIGLYLFDADEEPGAEVYTAATTRDQARITHSEAARMVSSSPSLKRRIRNFKDNLSVEATSSKFEPLSRDYNSMDGLNIHCAIVDELHAHKTRDTWDVLETATGARRQPLLWAITTSGHDRHSICREQHDYVEKILSQLIEDDSYFGIIYTLDEGDDWKDESLWIKANPNLGVSVKIDDLRRKAKKAQETPAALNAFLRLHMNIWTSAETRWMMAEDWEACSSAVKVNKGWECYGGLDLSSTTDLSAFVLVFPPQKGIEKCQVLVRAWIPDENMVERSRRDRVPYDVWVRQGFLVATPGNVIDYKWIIDQIGKDAKEYDLKEIAFDRWGAAKIVQDLQAMGFEDESEKHARRHLIGFGQGYKSMSPPMKELEKLVLSRSITHGGHPVLLWAADNVMATEDPAGNIKPDKSKSIERIDPIVALIMALDRALKRKSQSSVYSDREVMVL